jgi:hypothetical protein
MKKPEVLFWRAHVMRNPSWLASVGLMLSEGFWTAPWAFVYLVGPPIINIVFAFLSLGMGLLIWIFGLASMIFFGLMGRLSPLDPPDIHHQRRQR